MDWVGIKEVLTDRALQREIIGDTRAWLAGRLVALAFRVEWREAWYEAQRRMARR